MNTKLIESIKGRIYRIVHDMVWEGCDTTKCHARTQRLWQEVCRLEDLEG